MHGAQSRVHGLVSFAHSREMLRVGLERYRSSEMVRKKATQAIRQYPRDHRNAEGVHADRKSAPSQCAHQDGSGGRLDRTAAEEFRLDLPQPQSSFSSRCAAAGSENRKLHGRRISISRCLRTSASSDSRWDKHASSWDTCASTSISRSSASTWETRASASASLRQSRVLLKMMEDRGT